MRQLSHLTAALHGAPSGTFTRTGRLGVVSVYRREPHETSSECQGGLFAPRVIFFLPRRVIPERPPEGTSRGPLSRQLKGERPERLAQVTELFGQYQELSFYGVPLHQVNDVRMLISMALETPCETEPFSSMTAIPKPSTTLRMALESNSY